MAPASADERRRVDCCTTREGAAVAGGAGGEVGGGFVGGAHFEVGPDMLSADADGAEPIIADEA